MQVRSIKTRFIQLHRANLLGSELLGRGREPRFAYGWHLLLCGPVYRRVCRPSCHSRRPSRENVLFFQKRELAERAGFRACCAAAANDSSGPNPQVEMIQKSAASSRTTWMKNVTLSRLERSGPESIPSTRTFKDVIASRPKRTRDSAGSSF